MDMRAAIAEFMYSRDLSPASKLWYRARLGEFADWLASDGTVQVEAITPGQVRAYLAHAHDHPTPKGNARDSHTLHGYARALRAFLRWAASEGLVPATLPKKVVMPRMVAKVLPVLTKAQTDAMLDACITARDRAILAVLLDTGIRAAELTGLTLDRVHFSADDAYLVVHGKGRKQCEVGLGRRSRMLLHKYIYRYRRGADHGPVFVARGGAALTTSGLDQVLYRLRDRARLGKVRVCAHVWRHTYAYRYIDAGGDLFRLARLMGHSTVTVTQGYLSAFSAREARRGFSVLDGR